MQSTMIKPPWLKIKPPTNQFHTVKSIIKSNNLHTVCQEAHCPNTSECWSAGTATFMIMGDTCTRGCRFCAVKTGIPTKLDKNEPKNLAKAIKDIVTQQKSQIALQNVKNSNNFKLLTRQSHISKFPNQKKDLSGKQSHSTKIKETNYMKLFEYIVLTSVDRDDLIDQGANHFANCISEIKKEVPKILVEVLIPDFTGDIELLKIVMNAKPDVIAHNVETVKRLQTVRDRRANYSQSLNVLKNAKKINPKIHTKSSLMLGLGEKDDEVIQTMKDLRKINVDIITFGQYLKPKNRTLQIHEFVRPEKFKYFKEVAYELGFIYCASGPFVRSSYKAGEVFLKNNINKKNKDLKSEVN